MRQFILSAVTVSLLIGAVAFAAEQATNTTTRPDNTEVNAERESAGLKTASDAGQSESEVKLAANIRQALVGKKNLSIYAQNIKVVVTGTEVHLACPVRSVSEKREVERIARAEAGMTARVVSEINVAPVKKQ